MTTKLAKATIRTTGEQFWYETKLTWNQIYYSFDDGSTWHRTRTEAYRAARDGGNLHHVGEVKTVTV